MAKTKRMPRQLDVVAVAPLDVERPGALDPAAGDEVAEPLVELGELLVGRRVAEAHDEVVADVADRVVVGVEAVDLGGRRLARVGDEVQAACRPAPTSPRSTSWSRISSSMRSQNGSPGVSSSTIGTGRPLPVWVSVSSSNVSSSVPNPPGRQTNARLSLTSISLRVKKYFIATYFSSPAMTGLAPCSNGSRMATPMLLLAPGALHRRLHDPRPGAGDDHPPALGERRGDRASACS